MSPPLYERVRIKNTLQRLTDLTIFFLLLSLIFYRLRRFKDGSHGIVITWLLAFLCECWFTFTWLLIMSNKWNPVKHKAYPQNLLNRIDELPPVDMFVATADPLLEPPIITVNTVLSLLAVDYPANKLACYVSDDGASPVTFYSLVQTVEFAKLWVPYCKKYNVQVRAPFQYFSSDNQSRELYHISTEFLEERTRIKNEYKLLQKKIEDAQQNPASCNSEIFSGIQPRNHPTIIKVLWENKEGLADGLPHLVYVSREKNPKLQTNFKAGAMNVLARVSGVMTNSPIMLNVDCDDFVNNPQIVIDAMCFLLGTKEEKESGYVQFPQVFYGGHEDDPLGNQFVVFHEYMKHGIGGIQGCFYSGTACFHRRKVIYGLTPEELIKPTATTLSNGKSTDELKKIFGQSTKFVNFAAKCLSGLNEGLCCPTNITSSLQEAVEVADASYESGTEWGSKVGWMYGSASEDIQTGLKIHSDGWKSIYYAPDQPGFLGSAPSSGLACMIQGKRWATGLLQIHLTPRNPIMGTIFKNLQFRQCLAYLYLTFWGLRSLPELCYVALPAYCLITDAPFLPSMSEPATLIPTSLFLVFHIYALIEYLRCGLSARAWWNNHRMYIIVSTSAWFFGLLTFILKLLRLSDKAIFEITPKAATNSNTNSTNDDDSNQENKSVADSGKFTFDESLMFLPGTTLVLVHSVAVGLVLVRFLMAVLGRLNSPEHGREGAGLWEIICSCWVLLNFLPFVKGFFRRGKYGIPSSTICKSVAFAGIFLQFCRWASRK